MTPDELKRLRDGLLARIAAGDTLAEIEAWCDAYACRWADLIEVIRLLAAEHEQARTK